MATVGKKGDNIITVGSNIRIERGPALAKAIATPELLSNEKTAAHYAVGMQDAKGEFIEEGKEFHYLDYGGVEAEGKYVYYVYKRHDFTPEEQEARETSYTYIYDEIGTRATEEAALEFAQKHAVE